jgi:heat shock protein HtpX
MKRIIMFVVTNLLIMATISIVLLVISVLFGVSFAIGGQTMQWGALMIYSLVVGFTGSLLSLAFSRVIAKSLMGVKILRPGEMLDAREAKVVNDVHQLCRQAGLKEMPEVGIYKSDEVNAFATGPTKNRSLVALSSGLLDRMDERSIEAVIAHEVAHIVNGDMVTMTLLQGLINTFVVFLSRAVAFVLSRLVRPQLSVVVYWVVAIVSQIFFSILGALVVMAYSRQREFKADAGAAGWVGKAQMAHALRSLQSTHGLIDDSHKSLSTLKINGKSGIAYLFSSHPPLEERIRRLES